MTPTRLPQDRNIPDDCEMVTILAVAWPTTADGIVVTNAQGSNGWTLTHSATGRTIIREEFKTRMAAMRGALPLAAACDWTQHHIDDDEDLKAARQHARDVAYASWEPDNA